MSLHFLKKSLAILSFGLLAIFASEVFAAVPPLDSFRPVHAEGGKTWLFSPFGVKELKDAQTGEKIVELWVRIDVPATKLRDVLQWRFSPERNAYKALDAYTYDFSGRLVDQ